jgi:hypothetical protein
MMVVETGSSTGSAASPNVPPAAPDAVTSARCRNCELVRGEDRSVRNATLSAASSPFEWRKRWLWKRKREARNYKFDGLADEVGEPAGEAGMLKRLDGPAQCVSAPNIDPIRRPTLTPGAAPETGVSCGAYDM